MRITYDPAKRARTLLERGIDFEDVVEIFASETIEMVDSRFDYGEERVVTVGFLRGRMMMVVWTQRNDRRHIISMRKANDREQARFGQRFGQN